MFGLFEDGQMRGIMRWYDFTMNFFGAQTLVGGIGGVAVDLLHKKEKVCGYLCDCHWLDIGRPDDSALQHQYNRAAKVIAVFARITGGIVAGFRSMLKFIRPALDAVASALNMLKDS